MKSSISLTSPLSTYGIPHWAYEYISPLSIILIWAFSSCLYSCIAALMPAASPPIMTYFMFYLPTSFIQKSLCHILCPSLSPYFILRHHAMIDSFLFVLLQMDIKGRFFYFLLLHIEPFFLPTFSRYQSLLSDQTLLYGR